MGSAGRVLVETKSGSKFGTKAKSATKYGTKIRCFFED
jgi:hypothetical protein